MPLVVRLAPRERSARRDCRIRILYMYTLVSTGHPPRRDAPRAGINYPPISRSNCSVERRSSLSSIGRSRPEGGLCNRFAGTCREKTGATPREHGERRNVVGRETTMWKGERRMWGNDDVEADGPRAVMAPTRPRRNGSYACSCSRSSVRRIFPVSVRGRDSQNSTERGYLYGARVFFT